MKAKYLVAATVAAALSANASSAQQLVATGPGVASAVAPATNVASTETAAPTVMPAPAVTVPVGVMASSPAPTCEMHVWPAARVNAVTQGAGSMFGLIGGLIDAAANADRNKRDKAFITSALDPAAQGRALRELDLPRSLSLPPATVIMHDEGIELNSETPGRLAQSSAPCYYDVVIRQLFYLKTATTRGKMRTFILVRGADGTKRVINYKDSANHALDVKLPEEGEDASNANRALIDAFKADVSQFSEKFVRKTSKS